NPSSSPRRRGKESRRRPGSEAVQGHFALRGAVRSSFDPPALVLLIGEGKSVRDVLGGFAKRPCAVPNLGRAFFGFGGSSERGAEDQQACRKMQSFHGDCSPITELRRSARPPGRLRLSFTGFLPLQCLREGPKSYRGRLSLGRVRGKAA